jgi:uncharacterized protein YbdZ (MbtH family)
MTGKTQLEECTTHLHQPNDTIIPDGWRRTARKQQRQSTHAQFTEWTTIQRHTIDDHTITWGDDETSLRLVELN